jgi:hypothetical protein
MRAVVEVDEEDHRARKGEGNHAGRKKQSHPGIVPASTLDGRAAGVLRMGDGAIVLPAGSDSAIAPMAATSPHATMHMQAVSRQTRSGLLFREDTGNDG